MFEELSAMFTTLSASVVLLAAAAGFLRAVRGPGFYDRLLGMLFAGTASAAFLMLISAEQANHGVLDAALALVILAPVLTVVCVAVARRGGAKS